MKFDFSKLARRNQIYIIPNGNGVVYIGINIVVLIAAATFANNLVYMLAFLMLAIFLMGMVQSHLNLKGVSILKVEASDSYAKSPVNVSVQVENSSQQLKQNIWIDPAANHSCGKGQGGSQITEIEPGRRRVLSVKTCHWARGVHKLPDFYIKTRYPLGLFTAWKVERPKGQIYVYPAAEGDMSLDKAPVQGLDTGSNDIGRSQRGVEFNEHQRFYHGDSYRHVDWKVYARKRVWLKKQFDGEGERVLRFDFARLPYSETEKKLAQLSKWIKEAFERDIPYELNLPSTKLEAGIGGQHFVKSQRLLASFEGVAP